ncbi:MAG: SPFH domain-containing protein [Bifidobacteriaceae bacterium]|jgi:regulator of protease activity HflC (stomatin/prohibitin superfamily)|nr:SPFH domain-containing protein [Bifidobacteriaceae bacterium]
MSTTPTASSTESRSPTGAKPPAEAPPAVAERPARTAPGWIGLVTILVLLGGGIALIALGVDRSELAIAGGALAILVSTIPMCSLTIVVPGTTKVLLFFGSYVGTVRQPGFWLVVPFATHTRVSVRVRNFETNELKVNDADGTPVHVAAIVVWEVAETAQASFAVEDYKKFVHVQSEAALRHVVMDHPYDGPDSTITLRGSADRVSAELAREVAARVAVAGIAIVEVRISKLSYAPEIAEAMLRRQQAGAIIAAREKIVEGAVTVVNQALRHLEEDGTVQLDDERRAAMVSNLLVVLTSDQQVSPVVNTGSLYT